MENENIWVRYSAPTKFEPADYGQIWRQTLDSAGEPVHKFYIQTSKDIDNPVWMKMGDFLEIALQGCYNNNDDVTEWLMKWDYWGTRKK